MYRIRKVKTKSGSIAIQVVLYEGHRAKIIKHVGSGKEEKEIDILKAKAQQWIDQYSGQQSLFVDHRQKVLIVERAQCILVSHMFSYNFFMGCIKEIGLMDLPLLLLHLSMIRLIEPASKLYSIELLDRYFGKKYSLRIYRQIPDLVTYKAQIEEKAFKLVRERFKEQFYYILYDVTTLYFESFKSDELRIEGFSKDNKPQQPQIVIGLLVTQSGFPLAYDVYSGNTFEGKTMLPIVEGFISKHPSTKPIVIADAAMLDEKRLTELTEKNISYIVGARLTNTNLDLVKQIYKTLNGVNGANSRFNSKHGHLVCDYSEKRYKKELNELNKLIKKAEHVVEKQSCSTRTKFVKKISKEKVILNTDLIEKRKLLLGIKGYCTDIPENKLSNQEVIERYHDLWRVEQTFRMSKFDIETRPIYHYKQEAIKAHVLICFVALIIEKYLEVTTNTSLKKIKTLVWNITETHIQDTLTKEIFKFISPTSEILNSPLAPMIKKWKLLPH